MTQEQQHMFEYLKVFLTENWNNLSEYAKENPDTHKPYKNVKQLLRNIECDVNILDWYFNECLRVHVEDRNVLEELCVFEGDDFNVYEINNKFVKVWSENFDNYYQFVEKKDFDVQSVNEDLQSIIDRLTKENEELKIKLKQYEN